MNTAPSDDSDVKEGTSSAASPLTSAGTERAHPDDQEESPAKVSKHESESKEEGVEIKSYVHGNNRITLYSNTASLAPMESRSHSTNKICGPSFISPRQK